MPGYCRSAGSRTPARALPLRGRHPGERDVLCQPVVAVGLLHGRRTGPPEEPGFGSPGCQPVAAPSPDELAASSRGGSLRLIRYVMLTYACAVCTAISDWASRPRSLYPPIPQFPSPQAGRLAQGPLPARPVAMGSAPRAGTGWANSPETTLRTWRRQAGGLDGACRKGVGRTQVLRLALLP